MNQDCTDGGVLYIDDTLAGVDSNRLRFKDKCIKQALLVIGVVGLLLVGSVVVIAVVVIPMVCCKSIG